MKATRISMAGVFVCSLLASGANAQEAFPDLKDKITLIQKYQPVLRSYPGVSVDILGIRTGMTVSKAEAMAEKSYGNHGQPFVSLSSDWVIYDPGNFTILSRPFIHDVTFSRDEPMTDMLSLYFSSPATGNTLLGIVRQIMYYSSPTRTPSITTIEALLIRKYGRFSYQSKAQGGRIRIGWVFGQKGIIRCKPHGCTSGPFLSEPVPFGATSRSPSVFRIDAEVDAKKSAKTEVGGVTVSMWDMPTSARDAKEAKRQLTAAAIKYYKNTHKPPPGPKL